MPPGGSGRTNLGVYLLDCFSEQTKTSLFEPVS